MSWTKVEKGYEKPLKWWAHKVCCEWGLYVYKKDEGKTYYHHLYMLMKCGFQLDGTPITNKMK